MRGVFDLVVVMVQTDDAPNGFVPPVVARLRALGLDDGLVVIRADRRLVERRLIQSALHRAAFQHAIDAGAQRPLVFEEGCLLHADPDRLFARAAAELAQRSWSIVSLGGAHDEAAMTPLAPSSALSTGVFEGCFANGYRRETLTSLLADMPADAPRLADWIAREESIDACLARVAGRVLVAPRIATLAHLLPYEDPALREGFVR